MLSIVDEDSREVDVLKKARTGADGTGLTACATMSVDFQSIYERPRAIASSPPVALLASRSLSAWMRSSHLIGNGVSPMVSELLTQTPT